MSPRGTGRGRSQRAVIRRRALRRQGHADSRKRISGTGSPSQPCHGRARPFGPGCAGDIAAPSQDSPVATPLLDDAMQRDRCATCIAREPALGQRHDLPAAPFDPPRPDADRPDSHPGRKVLIHLWPARSKLRSGMPPPGAAIFADSPAQSAPRSGRRTAATALGLAAAASWGAACLNRALRSAGPPGG